VTQTKRPPANPARFKTEEQQAALMLHKTRELLVRQQTMLINAIRGHMAELGMSGRRALQI
jgi:transposase